jgi:hypothetical protein
MKAKTFDCVEMKRKGSLRIYEETKDLTFEEKVMYWRRKSEEALSRHAQRAKHVGKTR